ncbi:unnamed protein product [Phytophthora lilii]|uniref:Unnamed protein product n=1 Tax=Phytophthora lilii TaxID=2077276 RepID=A0A9W6U5U3_9STRA|nr:unnamed protein product [Phytophthora lilii]
MIYLISIILKLEKETDRFVKSYLSAGLRETIETIINDLNNPYYTIEEHIDDQRRFADYVFGDSVNQFVRELLNFQGLRAEYHTYIIERVLTNIGSNRHFHKYFNTFNYDFTLDKLNRFECEDYCKSIVKDLRLHEVIDLLSKIKGDFHSDIRAVLTHEAIIKRLV